MSNLYKFQEWLESKVKSAIPADIEVLCRRKGNIENDISNSLASLGLAVVVEPPLPISWSDTFILKAENVESEIHILENVLLDTHEETTYSLLEKVAKAIHQERYDELGASLITLGSIRDDSPADEPIIHFVLPITNALNL